MSSSPPETTVPNVKKLHLGCTKLMNMKCMITRSSHYSVNHPSVRQVLLHSFHKEMDHAVDEGNISKKKGGTQMDK